MPWSGARFKSGLESRVLGFRGSGLAQDLGPKVRSLEFGAWGSRGGVGCDFVSMHKLAPQEGVLWLGMQS